MIAITVALHVIGVCRMWAIQHLFATCGILNERFFESVQSYLYVLRKFYVKFWHILLASSSALSLTDMLLWTGTHIKVTLRKSLIWMKALKYCITKLRNSPYMEDMKPESASLSVADEILPNEQTRRLKSKRIIWHPPPSLSGSRLYCSMVFFFVEVREIFKRHWN